jgi:hypothetical protein
MSGRARRYAATSTDGTPGAPRESHAGPLPTQENHRTNIAARAFLAAGIAFASGALAADFDGSTP